ncbi:MAG: DUF167 domain-containing protein [Phycisphaerales bacterium]|nr:DUF167 domain-containing protein [Phycisphaerales bacterium]
MHCLKSVDNGVEIHVKVIPGASRDRIAGLLGDALKVHVAAPPEKGKANRAVEALLAKAMGVPERDVIVTSGQTSPHKVVMVTGVTPHKACRDLNLA